MLLVLVSVLPCCADLLTAAMGMMTTWAPDTSACRTQRRPSSQRQHTKSASRALVGMLEVMLLMVMSDWQPGGATGCAQHC
jgi:hypothetical protein